ncbi:MAG: aldo/keto reductase [Bacteroidota bacterium]|nr:aldo/keto reductase [Bacteroidota bacterium]
MNVSRTGFGCYRVDISIREHHDALYKALTNGINLIDTSANYSDGGSESLVGKVVNDLTGENKIKREDIIIVTKGGYIQGQNYRLASKLKEEGKAFKEVVEYADGLWHCINPDFLEDQLRRQMQRLNLTYIDIYLLHNPEYYLQLAKKNGMDPDEAREIYYSRIRNAFEFFESKVSEGLIKSYGISSNTFASYSTEHDFTSLEKITDIANSISTNHNFKTIQLPFNLFEAGAVTVRNQSNNTQTVLEFASGKNLSVLINRPLNASTSKGLVRLADFKAEPFLEKDFIKQMKLVTLMEEDIINEKLAEEKLNEADLIKLKKFLSSGRLVEENWKYFGSIEHFNDILYQLFAPRIDFLNNFFEDKIQEKNTQDFFHRYIKECYKLLNYVSNYYKLRADKRSSYIHNLLNKDLAQKFHNLTLSQKAILLLASVEGVSCVLAGMRKVEYVDDVLSILDQEKIPNAKEIIEYVSKEIQMADN